MNTYKESSLLMALVSVVNSFAWLLLAGVSYNAVVVSWFVATVFVAGIAVWKISGSVIREPAWWFWLVLSVVGIVVNWLGSSVLSYSYALGYYPWYPVVGVGYLFSGLYNKGDKRLNRLDRGVLVFSGVVSLLISVLSVTVFSRPNLLFESRFASPVILFCLTVIPTMVLSIRFGIRAKDD